MFTQLFGSYLLNKNLLTVEQLKDALEYQKTVRLKLGVMAVNSGFMTAEDVNAVHNMQSKADKKFGELAIEMGFLDKEKLDILLSTQKSGHLLLGQAIVDKEYMTLEQFENALNEYKKDHSLTNEQFKSLQNDDIEAIVNAFYGFESAKDNKFYKNYFALLVRDIVRFIDDDFRPLEIFPLKEIKFDWLASQEISGEDYLFTSLSAEENVFVNFASKFAKETYTSNDEYVKSAASEFLNLNNGLFLVNMSNENVELELTPQLVDNNKTLITTAEAFCIPILFTFGKVDFIVAKSKPDFV